MSVRKVKPVRQWFLFACIFWLAGWLPAGAAGIPAANAAATEGDDMIDYGQIQEAMDEMLLESVQISFSDLVGQLVNGDIQGVFAHLKDYLLDQLFYEIRSNRIVLVQMAGIVFISAVFTNFSMAFSKTFVAETGFYLTYMVLFSLLLTSFMTVTQMASGLMGNMLKFMSALVPVFCLAVTFTGNIQTGMWYQQAMVTGITLTEWLISKFILSMIHMYVLISLVNQLSKENALSKCADLIKTVAGWSLKTVLGVILGLNFIQSLVMPAFDSLKNGWAMRVTSAVPGVGDAMGTAMQTVIGSAVLIKNGIGAAGLIVLAFLFLIPAVKLAVIVLMYQAAQAIVQPVADKRMLTCLHCVAEGVLLILKVQGMVFILFFLSMAMMTAASGAVFG
ncbi:stage III sporulation protein AE [Frisingicoccus sp.]|uniref:stage III sporulation protein AE n=1 Tax=Frisingicoccus sp. TaxID=1918627 RepID=UPI003AB80E3A